MKPMEKLVVGNEEYEIVDAVARSNFITPQMFGAAGNGATDDTQALIDCALYCANNNMIMFVSEKTNLYIPERTVITGLKQIKMCGTITAPNGIEFRFNSNQVCNDWYFNKINGELTLSGLKNSLVTIISATSLVLLADSAVNAIGSISYNQFMLGYVPSLTLQGNGTGWINENTFLGGRIKSLHVLGGYSHNHNFFLNNCFESAAINFETGNENYILNARFEGSNNSAVFSNNACGNVINRTWLGFSNIGSWDAPDWFVDNTGHNCFYYGRDNAYKTLKKELTATSFNYPNAVKVYPLNGKLHVKDYVDELIKTNVFSIEHAVGVHIKSDQKFFRGYVRIYDQNGEQITTPPSVTPFYGTTLTWDTSNNAYWFGGSNRQNTMFSLARIKGYNGQDSGVYYAQIVVYGYAAADIDYVKLELTVPWYTDIVPFGEEKTTAAAQPTAGDWSNGAIVYNTDPTNRLLGWFYNNGAWHVIGSY